MTEYKFAAQSQKSSTTGVKMHNEEVILIYVCTAVVGSFQVIVCIDYENV